MASVDRDVGEVESLAGFLAREERAASPDGMTSADMAQLVAQARALLAGVYVHGPLKRATEAYDVDRALDGVERWIDDLDRAVLDDPAAWAGAEWRFHGLMLGALGRLRDFHTRYVLPERFRRTAAFLPFLVERTADGLLVTKVNRRYVPAASGLVPGVLVLDWNGVPAERAVELVGETTSGGNPAARRARGLEALTIRPLDMTPPPDERWVVVGFRAAGAGGRDELRVDWRVLTLPREPDAVDPDAWRRQARIAGIDPQGERMRRVKRHVLSPAATPGRGSLFAASTSPVARGEVGYLRIWSFDTADEGRFVRALARALDDLPPDGLVVDVRGNGGGNIAAAEAALSLLSPRPIERAPLQFLVSPWTRAIAEEPWADSIAEAGSVGEVLCAPHPLVPSAEWAELTALGQRYEGPKVLVVDALSYSATDFFAAGWQDNGVGPVAGTDARTGAGGANVWSYRVVRRALREGSGAGAVPPRLAALKGGASLRVAVRRSLRVGPRAGVPLEGLGVAVPENARLALTRRDALGDAEGRPNTDLVAAAAALLDGEPRPLLRGRRLAGGRLRVTTRALDRLEIVGEDGSRETAAVDRSDLTVPVPAGRVRLEGFAGRRLLASRVVPAARG